MAVLISGAIMAPVHFVAIKLITDGKKAGRVLAIVLSVLYLPVFPVGTVAGLFMLTKVSDPDVAHHCRR
jgi:hypothetical protein